VTRNGKTLFANYVWLTGTSPYRAIHLSVMYTFPFGIHCLLDCIIWIRSGVTWSPNIMWITKIFILKLEIWTRCKRNGRWWWMLTMDLGLRSFTKHWRNMGSFACMRVTTGVCFATVPHQLWKNDNQGVSINLKYWVVPRISLYFFYRELAPNDGWW